MLIPKLKTNPALLHHVLKIGQSQGLTLVNCAKQGGTLSPQDLRLAIVNTMSVWTGIIGLKPEDGSLVTSLDWANFKTWYRNKPDKADQVETWKAECPLEGSWIKPFLDLGQWMEDRHFGGLKTLAMPELVEHRFNPVSTDQLAAMGVTLTPTVCDPQLQRLAAWQLAGVLCGISETVMISEEWEIGQMYWLANGKAHSNWMAIVVEKADFLTKQFANTPPQHPKSLPTGLVPKGVGLPDGSLKRERKAWAKRFWRDTGGVLVRQTMAIVFGATLAVNLMTATNGSMGELMLARGLLLLSGLGLLAELGWVWWNHRTAKEREPVRNKRPLQRETTGDFNVEDL